MSDRYAKGIAYLTKAGSEVIIVNKGIKIVMRPSSAHQDINKEKPRPHYIISPLNNEASFTKDFINEFKVAHKVDLDRLLRTCSILIMAFTEL